MVDPSAKQDKLKKARKYSNQRCFAIAPEDNL
jgi:hypothetical protein